MAIELHVKSADLLGLLANSIYDRDPNPCNPFTFSITEIQLVERWLKDFIEELKKPDSF